LRNAGVIDLGEIELRDPPPTPPPPVARSSRRALAALGVVVVVWATAVLWPRADDEVAVVPPPERTVDTEAGLVVFPAGDLDEVVVLGLPYGARAEGELASIDLATGEVRHEVRDGERWPDVFSREPSGDTDLRAIEAEIPGPPPGVVEAGARSPDGRHLAVFARRERDRGTGVSVYTEGRMARRFHRLQSVGGLIGQQLVWSPDSDAVYLMVDDRASGASANRVVAIPVDGSARTVVRIDGLGWRWLAVQASTT
jgi:hypothetical protein